MTDIASHQLLITTLHAAVPLWIQQLAHLDDTTRDQIRIGWAHAAADAVAYKGDALQFGGKRGEAAEVFNHLARGLAAAAYNPGGITFAGQHWCTNHGECIDADRHATEPLHQPDTDPAPTYRGRPIIDLNVAGVL